MIGKLSIKSNFGNNDKLFASSSDDNDSECELTATVTMTNKKKNKRKLRPLEKEDTKKQKESSPIQHNTQQQLQPQIALDSSSLRVFNEFYSSCITNDPEKLLSLLEKYKLSSDNKGLDLIINHRFDKSGLTLLHLTSSMGYVECVKILLLNGSDPTISTYDEKKVPYLMSKTKAVRDQFRRFMYDYPLLYDYSLSKIPSGLSQEKEIEKQNKEKEKRKLQRKLKKERDEESKIAQMQIQFENDEKCKFLSLNDEEKRLLLIEKNFINSKNSKVKDQTTMPTIKLANKINPERLPVIISRCWFCADNLSTSVPYEYYDYKFCSIKCLKLHRQNNNNNNNNMVTKKTK